MKLRATKFAAVLVLVVSTIASGNPANAIVGKVGHVDYVCTTIVAQSAWEIGDYAYGQASGSVFCNTNLVDPLSLKVETQEVNGSQTSASTSDTDTNGDGRINLTTNSVSQQRHWYDLECFEGIAEAQFVNAGNHGDADTSCV